LMYDKPYNKLFDAWACDIGARQCDCHTVCRTSKTAFLVASLIYDYSSDIDVTFIQVGKPHGLAAMSLVSATKRKRTLNGPSTSLSHPLSVDDF
jgi:hypothetical protein